MGWSWVLALARSNERWRLGRRMLDRSLRSTATASYLPTIQARARVFLSRMLETPHQWEDHLDLSVGFAFELDYLSDITRYCQPSRRIDPRHDIRVSSAWAR